MKYWNRLSTNNFPYLRFSLPVVRKSFLKTKFTGPNKLNVSRLLSERNDFILANSSSRSLTFIYVPYIIVIIFDHFEITVSEPALYEIFNNIKAPHMWSLMVVLPRAEPDRRHNTTFHAICVTPPKSKILNATRRLFKCRRLAVASRYACTDFVPTFAGT